MKQTKFLTIGVAAVITLFAPMAAQAATINIGGSIVIGNDTDDGTRRPNIHFAQNAYLTISEEHPLQPGVKIGVVKGHDDGVFMQSGAREEHLQYIFSNRGDWDDLVLENEQLRLIRKPPTFADLIFHETNNLSPRAYDGTAKSVKHIGNVRGPFNDNQVLPLGGIPGGDIHYTGTDGTIYSKSTTAPSAAGRYSVTLTNSGNAIAPNGYGPGTDLPLGTLIIYSDDKPVPTAALLAYDLSPVTYNGSPQSAAVTPKPNIHGLGAITVYYDDGSGEGKSTTPPTNAGTYAVTVDIAEGGDPTRGWGAAEGLELGNFVINKAPAPTITFPTSTPIIYGATLSTSTLSGGSTEYGSFAWTDGAIVPTVTNNGYEVTFTPSVGTVNNYKTITTTTAIVAITVNKANQSPPVPPTGLPDMTAASTWMWIFIALSLGLWGYVGYGYISRRKS